MGNSAHVDRFVLDNLPPPEQQPDLIFSLPALQYPARLNAATELLRRFEPGRRYPEREVNDILRSAHDDVATLRRELIDYRYLRREGAVYWVNERQPARDANEAQEVPEGEAAWLRALLRSKICASISSRSLSSASRMGK